jgi:hypothetical protein
LIASRVPLRRWKPLPTSVSVCRPNVFAATPGPEVLVPAP